MKGQTCSLLVGDKAEEVHIVLIEIEDVASKKLGLQIFWTQKINEFPLQLKLYFFAVDIKRKRENF